MCLYSPKKLCVLRVKMKILYWKDIENDLNTVLKNKLHKKYSRFILLKKI